MTFANLDTTDRAELPGGVVHQRLEALELALLDGAQITLARDFTGSAVLRVTAQGGRVVVALPAELAIRLGSHLAALGAATLEPGEPE